MCTCAVHIRHLADTEEWASVRAGKVFTNNILTWGRVVLVVFRV